MGVAAARSIKFRIIALVVLIFAPLIVVFAIVAISLASANRMVIEAEQIRSAHQLSAAIDREIVELKGMLDGVAIITETLAEPKVAANEQLAKKAKLANIFGIWKFSSDGLTTEQFVDLLPESPNHSLTPDFISRVLAGEVAVSDVYGEGMQNATVVIGVPVFDENNKAKSGLAAEVSVSVFDQAFKHAGMKNGWVAAVVDKNGHFVGRSMNAESRVGTEARPELRAVSQGVATSGTFENVTLEGTAVFNSFERSPLSQWTYVMAIPKSELAAPFREALAYTVIGGLVAMGLSILAATLMAARIAKPISNLSQYATSLAQGQKVEPEKYRITEIENVRSSLNAALAKSARLTALVTSSGDAVIGVGLNGEINAWNKGAETLFGYTADDIIGKPKSILVPEDLRAEFDAQRPQIIAGEIIRAESVRLSRDGKRMDIEFVDAPVTDSFGMISGYSTIIRDISERTAAREHRQLLMRELAHRTKNQLAIVQSIANQTGRNSRSIDGFITAFNGRIQGLSASHDILAKQQWQAIPITELVKSQVAVLVSTIDKFFVISGPDIALTAVHAEALGLALHELTTNSIKYGALSAERGRVAISWHVEKTSNQSKVIFEWQESGGPKIKEPPEHQGFGSRVLTNVVALSLGGQSHTDYRTAGLYWRVIWEPTT